MQITDTFLAIVKVAEDRVEGKRTRNVYGIKAGLYRFEIEAYAFYLQKRNTLPEQEVLDGVARILYSDDDFFEKKMHEILSASLKKSIGLRSENPEWVNRHLRYIRASVEEKSTNDILAYLMPAIAEQVPVTESEADFMASISRNHINAYRLALAMKKKNEPLDQIFLMVKFTLLG